MMDHEYFRTIASVIIDEFDSLLEEHGVVLPDELREGRPEECAIFGETYCNLEVWLSNFLKEEWHQTHDKEVQA